MKVATLFFKWTREKTPTDFTTMDKTHEPPTNYTLSSTQNTIAAELKNNSTCGSPAGDLKFYWAMGSTGEMWEDAILTNP